VVPVWQGINRLALILQQFSITAVSVGVIHMLEAAAKWPTITVAAAMAFFLFAVVSIYVGLSVCLSVHRVCLSVCPCIFTSGNLACHLHLFVTLSVCQASGRPARCLHTFVSPVCLSATRKGQYRPQWPLTFVIVRRFVGCHQLGRLDACQSCM
jgi:hypothetical protein